MAQCCHYQWSIRSPWTSDGAGWFQSHADFSRILPSNGQVAPSVFCIRVVEIPSGFLRMIVLVHPCNNVYAPEGSRTTAPMKTQTEGHHLAVPVNRLVLNVSRQGLWTFGCIPTWALHIPQGKILAWPQQMAPRETCKIFVNTCFTLSTHGCVSFGMKYFMTTLWFSEMWLLSGQVKLFWCSEGETQRSTVPPPMLQL